MNIVGKTIARVDDYGDLIVFTDGTALHLSSDDGHYVEHLDGAGLRREQGAAQGRREQERLRRLQRAEWLSVSCEERGRRRVEQEARMSWLELAVRADRRGYLLTPTRYRKLCEVCRDPDCENTRTVPVTIDFGTMTINIPKLAG